MSNPEDKGRAMRARIQPWASDFPGSGRSQGNQLVVHLGDFLCFVFNAFFFGTSWFRIQVI